jgi:hypothetical protein
MVERKVFFGSVDETAPTTTTLTGSQLDAVSDREPWFAASSNLSHPDRKLRRDAIPTLYETTSYAVLRRRTERAQGLALCGLA